MAVHPARWARFLLTVFVTTGAVMSARGAGVTDRPWTTISDRATVTRRDSQPGVPNPLRHVPDEVLVRLKSGASRRAASQALAAVPSVSTRALRTVEHLYHLKLAPGVSLHRALRALGRHPDVLYAEPNFVLEAFATPNDPSFPTQWALQNTGQGGGTPGADVGAVSAWDLTVGSSGVVVAVLDTGVDYTHEDLAANMFRNLADCDADGVDDDGNGYVDDCYGIDAVNGDSDPMDDNDHGTHVAGTIGAVGNNLIGVAGVNWRVRMLPCKFLDATGTGSTAGAIACLDYVAAMKDRGVNVVATNNSWGGGLFSRALLDAMAAQQQRGILFVAAAGNAGRDNDVLRTYPCSYSLPNVLCVAATTAQDGRAWFSNYGRGTVHLGAPGVGILSTVRGNSYASFDGTSMATPHVSGTVALLHAQSPGRDWRTVRNLILAGGDTRPALAGTISGKRLNARGALDCNGSALSARLRPARTQVLTGIAPVELSALNINCGDPAGNVTVTVSPTGESVILLDDGSGRDQVAGDGSYTSTWTPPAGGPYDLGFPDGSVVRVEVDPQLKPGFPVQTFAGPGSYHGGPAIHVLAADIDGDPAAEILVTALAQGPLYAWNADGTPVAGWPQLDVPGAVYPAAGELAATEPGHEVFAAYYGADPDLVARRGSGLPLPGWPRRSANYVAAPASLADVDGDGIAEIFTEEEDWKLHAYRASGAPLAGWPAVQLVGGQERHTPAVADLDGDGDLEIVTASGWTSANGGSVYLFAYHHDGTLVAGFPVFFQGRVDTFPVVGDVDGDGQPEIVVAGWVGTSNGALVFSANGTLERTMAASGGVPYGTAPALADLDGDNVPEIVLQTDTAVNVWKGDGTVFPGWPVLLGPWTWLENAGPAVGDLDGDRRPDIAVLAPQSGGNEGDVLVLRSDGTTLPGFPKRLAGLGGGAVPAIADIDLDGRNDLIVASSYWDGYSGYYDKVWVYDLGGPVPHGPVEWGQFMSSPSHHGRYEPVGAPSAFRLVVGRTGEGTGVVASAPPGIDCGTDCTERYPGGTSVTLTATAASGSVFTSWSGACAGQGNPCAIAMNADESVTADFAPLFTLAVAVTGSGSGAVTSNPTGIDCGSDCSEVYLAGTNVTLTATAAAGSLFVSWNGACSGQGNPCTVAMNAPRFVSARFEPAVTLTVQRVGHGTGTVTSQPGGIVCGTDCAELYVRGVTVTLTATPEPGSRFLRWEGACSGHAATCTLVMDTSKLVRARFWRGIAEAPGGDRPLWTRVMPSSRGSPGTATAARED